MCNFLFLDFSREYLENIGIVDKGIQEIVAEMEKFYNNDGKTSYLLTADHGMTSWGKYTCQVNGISSWWCKGSYSTE